MTWRRTRTASSRSQPSRRSSSKHDVVGTSNYQHAHVIHVCVYHCMNQDAQCGTIKRGVRERSALFVVLQRAGLPRLTSRQRALSAHLRPVGRAGHADAAAAQRAGRGREDPRAHRHATPRVRQARRCECRPPVSLYPSVTQCINVKRTCIHYMYIVV